MTNSKTLFKTDLALLLSKLVEEEKTKRRIKNLTIEISRHMVLDEFSASDIKLAKELLKLDSKSCVANLALLKKESLNFKLYDSETINDLFDSVINNEKDDELFVFEDFWDYCKKRKAYFKEKMSYKTPEQIEKLFQSGKYEDAFSSVVYYFEKQHDIRMLSKLAFYYEKGIMVKKDTEKAKELYIQAVEKAKDYSCCYPLYVLFSDNKVKANKYLELGVNNNDELCLKENERLKFDAKFRDVIQRARENKSYKSDYPILLSEARKGVLEAQAYIAFANLSGRYTSFSSKEAQSFVDNLIASKFDKDLIIRCCSALITYFEKGPGLSKNNGNGTKYREIAREFGDFSQDEILGLREYYQDHFQKAKEYFLEGFSHGTVDSKKTFEFCSSKGRGFAKLYAEKRQEKLREYARQLLEFCTEIGDNTCYYDLASLYVDDNIETAVEYIQLGKAANDHRCMDEYSLFLSKAVELWNKNFEKSKEYYLIARKYGYKSSYYDMGKAFFSEGEYDKSIEYFSLGISNNEVNSKKGYMFFSKAAEKALNSYDLNQAIYFYSKASLLGDTKHYFDLAKLYMETNQGKLAFEAFLNGKRNKDARCFQYDLFLDKAKEFEKSGKYQEASEYYSYAMDAGDENHHYEFGILCFKLGKLQEAKEQFKAGMKAKDSRCQSRKIFTDCAKQLAKEGDISKAIQYFEAAYELGERNFDEDLIRCYLKIDDLDGAKRIYEKTGSKINLQEINSLFIDKAKDYHANGKQKEAIDLLSYLALDKGQSCYVLLSEYQMENGDVKNGFVTIEKGIENKDEESVRFKKEYYAKHFANFSIEDMYLWCRKEPSKVDYGKASQQDIMNFIELNERPKNQRDSFVKNTFQLMDPSEDKTFLMSYILLIKAYLETKEDHAESSALSAYLAIRFYDGNDEKTKLTEENMITFAKQVIEYFKLDLNDEELLMLFNAGEKIGKKQEIQEQLVPYYFSLYEDETVCFKKVADYNWKTSSIDLIKTTKTQLDQLLGFKERHKKILDIAQEFYLGCIKKGYYSYYMHLACLCDDKTALGKSKIDKCVKFFLKLSINRKDLMAQLCFARIYARFNKKKALRFYEFIFMNTMNKPGWNDVAKEAYAICTGFFEKRKWGKRMQLANRLYR